MSGAHPEAVRLTVAELGKTPLIGFAGAPFTLAAYMVEGKPSRDHLGPRTINCTPIPRPGPRWPTGLPIPPECSFRPNLRQARRQRSSLTRGQDRWAWLTTPDTWRRHLPARLTTYVISGAPLIHFGTGTSELLVAMR